MLNDKSPILRRDAAVALGGIGSKAAIDPLVAALHEKRPMIRDPAKKALIRMGPGAKAAIPRLRKMTNDRKRWTRRAARDVLKKIE